MTRPVGSLGEVSQALLHSAGELACVGADGARHGPTLEELARHAKVARNDARWSVKNLVRSGRLAAVAERRVERRNRPVAEYAPVVVSPVPPAANDEVITLDRVMQMFVNR